jgi:hypothetical protein
MYWDENDQSIKEIDFFEVMEKTYGDKTLVKLPLYQRDAVWSEGRVCALWDSILRGFPLPLFLLVRGKGNSRSLAQDGMRTETNRNTDEDYFDLLDGQQRMIAISHGVMPGNTSTVRLWLDLAPTISKEKPHPYKYKYWLYPCTNVFPFGFNSMEKSGEHDFSPLHDSEIREIWEKIQVQDDFKDRDFYQIPLTKSFPWRANCPVPLDEIMGLLQNKMFDSVTLKPELIKLADKFQNSVKSYGKGWRPPDNSVVELVAKALEKLRNRKLAFQLIELDHEDEDNDYILFERIGRGGIQISQRQLAVSKLMLTLGYEGNDAIAKFQKTREGTLLETEDVIHALARIAYTTSKIKPEKNNEDFDKKLREWDLFDLNIDRLNTLKKDNELWARFSVELKSLCDTERLNTTFRNLFARLQFDPDKNENGFPLVQLAQTDRTREGISPITLHPLLLWHYKYGDSLLERNHSEDMLRWIIFANGIASHPKHERLNQEAFWHVFDSGQLDFTRLREDIFKNSNLAKEIGFICNFPKINREGRIFAQELEYKNVPTPEEVTELVARRLILQNWAADGVSKFVLMWNQRVLLHTMYDGVDMKHLPALFSKGRPFDRDHIVARQKLLYNTTGINTEALLDGIRVFFKQTDILKNSVLNESCFRKSVPNMNANYRYWPKHLNRADQDLVVKIKMNLAHIVENSGAHPLTKIFDGKHGDEVWAMSSIPLQDQSDWECLPPEDYKWNAELITKFIRIILKRQHYLYGNAYKFLTGIELETNFNPEGIIGNENYDNMP